MSMNKLQKENVLKNLRASISHLQTSYIDLIMYNYDMKVKEYRQEMDNMHEAITIMEIVQKSIIKF